MCTISQITRPTACNCIKHG